MCIRDRANIFFVIPSAVFLSLLITAVTEFFVDKKAHELIDHSEVSFEQSRDDAPSNDPEDSEEISLTLTPVESKGLVSALITLLVFLAIYFALLFIPASPFARPEEGFMQSPLIQAVAVPITLGFFFVGLAYGLTTGSIKSSGDIPDMMAKGLETMLPMLVLFFAVSQFLAWFQWSNLGPWTAIKGAELLQQWDLPPALLFAGLVAMVAVLNMLITSGSAQWALMAPVVVPMMMYVGVAPEVAQMLFRIGDSPTNIITPMSPFFGLALVLLQRYLSLIHISEPTRRS